jgi:hypothetical protein
MGPRPLEPHFYKARQPAASSLILSASTIVTRGIMTITGSPSSPFSVRVTSSLRQLTTLRMSEKPIYLGWKP